MLVAPGMRRQGAAVRDQTRSAPAMQSTVVVPAAITTAPFRQCRIHRGRRGFGQSVMLLVKTNIFDPLDPDRLKCPQTTTCKRHEADDHPSCVNPL